MKRKIYQRFIIALVLSFTILLPKVSLGAQLRIAVASNFRTAMKPIAQLFEAQSGHTLSLSFASTGKHYAQIINGAPFDVFLAADSERPQLMINQRKAIEGSLATYALGKLVLWSPNAQLIDSSASVLQSGDFYFLAIANPKLAPYGRAAQQALEAQGVWHSLSKRLVRAENINQAYQYIHSGSAQLGFVGLSQISVDDEIVNGSYWLVPQSLYAPIVQQLVRLTDNSATQQFTTFLQSEQVMEILQQYGYDIPNVE